MKGTGESGRLRHTRDDDGKLEPLLRAYHERRDIQARDEAVERLLPLVRSLAGRYANRGEPLEDLVQVGSIGLMKALDRFDPDRGVGFSSYAIPTIIGEIRRHFRDRTWALHVPRPVKELSVRLTRVVDELTTSLGRPPVVSEIAAAVDATDEEVIEALDCGVAYSTRSLDAAFDANGDETLAGIVGDRDAGFEQVEHHAVIADGLAALEPREQEIVRLRFFEELTQSQIAAQLGISQMHVSRLLRKALEIMQRQGAAGG